MHTPSFGLEFIEGLIDMSSAAVEFDEIGDPAGEPRLRLARADDPAQPAGYLRLFMATDDSHIDRMVHFRLQSDPVDTQLFFLFGRAETAMPHFHAQVVQFSADACVFNADWLPRLDPVDHPGYYDKVFGPVTKAYWKAINDRDNICALAPANPAIAAYLAPWSIGVGRPTNKDELDRVAPQIIEFMRHALELAHVLDYSAPDSASLGDRDRRHLDCFFDDKLDPRAWKGVYSVIGEAAGHEVKDIFKTPLRVSRNS